MLDVHITVIQGDGTFAALALAITVASVALADAGVEMWDLVTSSSLVAYKSNGRDMPKSGWLSTAVKKKKNVSRASSWWPACPIWG